MGKSRGGLGGEGARRRSNTRELYPYVCVVQYVITRGRQRAKESGLIWFGKQVCRKRLRDDETWPRTANRYLVSTNQAPVRVHSFGRLLTGCSIILRSLVLGSSVKSVNFKTSHICN